MTLGRIKCREGLKVCMNYKFNLLHHVCVVAKRVCAAAAETAAHEGDDNTPSGPTGRGVKSVPLFLITRVCLLTLNIMTNVLQFFFYFLPLDITLDSY